MAIVIIFQAVSLYWAYNTPFIWITALIATILEVILGIIIILMRIFSHLSKSANLSAGVPDHHSALYNPTVSDMPAALINEPSGI